MNELAVILGSSNEVLGRKICKELGVVPIKSSMITFGNGERQVEINESVRNKDVFVIQSSSNEQTNDHLMELFLILDALKRSSCYRVTTVMPNFPYARQDRKVKSRVAISAKLVANLIYTSGTDRFLTAELHSPQIGGFFDVPVDNLHMSRVFLPFIKQKYPNNNICIIAPDAGSVKAAKMYAGRLGCEVAMIYKNRSGPGEIKEMNLIGEVEGKSCIIIDDMADSCGTICKATELVMTYGATSVEAYCTHAILSGLAIDNLNNSELKKLYVTNTIDNSRVRDSNKIFVLPAEQLFSEAIIGINDEHSLSHLFDM
jgi:ribose-phosphate pyrophosphokinase